MDRRGFVPVVIALIVLGVLVAGGAVYYAATHTSSSSEPSTAVLKAATTATSTAPVHAPAYVSPNPHVYQSAVYGFSIEYPSDFNVVQGIDGQIFTSTDLDFNSATPIVSLIYGGPEYVGTNFLGGGITIFKIVPPSLGCKTSGLGMKTVGDLTFYHGVGAAGGGAFPASHDDFYFVSQGGDCFDIIARTVTSSSTGNPFTAKDASTLSALMDKVSLTFSFASSSTP